MKTVETPKKDKLSIKLLPQFKDFGKLIDSEGVVISEDLFYTTNGGVWSCIKKRNE